MASKKDTSKNAMKNPNDCYAEVPEGSIRSLLILQFFTPHKNNGIKEGFRRLALLLATGVFVFAIQATYAFQSDAGMFWNFLNVCIVVLMSFTFFFVTAAIVTSIGWVVEGFTNSKK